MNNCTSGLLWRSCAFLSFIWRSRTRYRIHSPFLYALIDEVIFGAGMPPELRAVEKLRKECRSSRMIINKTDFGKAAGSSEMSTYPVKTGKLARTSLTPSRLALRLHRLAKHMGALNILEIGTSLGFTTAFLALANRNGRVFTLEGCPELAAHAGSLVARLGIQNVRILEGRFEDTLGRALNQLGKVDLVYIDGDHRKEALLGNFERCLPYLHNDSVVVIDDIHHSPAMEEAWNQLIVKEEVRISLDFFHSGWIFFRKESSKDHFRLRYL